MRGAVGKYARHVIDILPPELRQRREFPDVVQAMDDLHFPDSLETARTARRRFVYEEFLVLQVALAVRRRALRDRLPAPILVVTPPIDAHIRPLFPFPLTPHHNQPVAHP